MNEHRRVKVAEDRYINVQQVRKDLRLLDEPAIDGAVNPCYKDGYYLKSLEKKYGLSLEDLRKVAR